MKNLKPTETTYWFTHDSVTGVFHSGVTEPGQTTSTDADKFEYGSNLSNTLEAYIEVAENLTLPVVDSNSDEPPSPGFYIYEGSLVQLKKEDCASYSTIYETMQQITSE